MPISKYGKIHSMYATILTSSYIQQHIRITSNRKLKAVKFPLDIIYSIEEFASSVSAMWFSFSFFFIFPSCFGPINFIRGRKENGTRQITYISKHDAIASAMLSGGLDAPRNWQNVLSVLCSLSMLRPQVFELFMSKTRCLAHHFIQY